MKTAMGSCSMNLMSLASSLELQLPLILATGWRLRLALPFFRLMLAPCRLPAAQLQSWLGPDCLCQTHTGKQGWALPNSVPGLVPGKPGPVHLPHINYKSHTIASSIVTACPHS